MFAVAVNICNYVCNIRYLSKIHILVPYFTGKKNFNTFTAIVDLSRSNFSIARAPLFQLKSAM